MSSAEKIKMERNSSYSLNVLAELDDESDGDDEIDWVVKPNVSTTHEEGEPSDTKSASVVYPQLKRKLNMSWGTSSLPAVSELERVPDSVLSESIIRVLPESPSMDMSSSFTEKKAAAIPFANEEAPDGLEINSKSESLREEGCMSPTTPTPGGEVEMIEAAKEFEATPGEFKILRRIPTYEEEEEAEEGADCHLFFIHRFCFSFCIVSLLALLLVCFIHYPKPLKLCLKLSLDDDDIMRKVLDDEGSYELNITNPNSIDVHIHGLEIKAYYGGVAEENSLLNFAKMDYHIPSHGTHISNQTYTFTQNCTAAVPISILYGCSRGSRHVIIFDLVTSFKRACVLSFVCQEGIAFKSDYESNCPEDDMVCTELGIFQLTW